MADKHLIRLRRAAAGCCLLLANCGVWAADDPARALQQHQLQRRQQEDALQLRMQQQQRAARVAPADARQKEALEKLHAGQRERQQELHYRQEIEQPAVQPGDDEVTRRAKAELERSKARQESQGQLRRMEDEAPAR